ncbi:SHC (Src homology 2 domain containing) transforming protein 1, partial [Columba livia]
MDLLQKSKYSHLRNESVSSAEEAAGVPVSPAESPSPSLAAPAPLGELSPEPEDSPTTFCSFFPKMDDKVMGPGVSYHVRYMGCVEVLQSMRALDFNTRTQVTREAIGLVCEAVPGAKGAVRRRKPCGRSLNSILGKSNLKFAGMAITLTISTSSLNLMATDCKQIIANHHMQSISFASGGDPDTAEYVAYVAKDPVNQRACHILECPEGLAQDVISTIGQAFELRFKQYLKNPPKLVTPHDRMAGFDGSAWDEEEMEEQLRREPWYHGKMNRKDAEKLLKVNGDFLVRESTTTPGQYVLTGLQGGQPKHLLLVDPEGGALHPNPKPQWFCHQWPLKCPLFVPPRQ